MNQKCIQTDFKNASIDFFKEVFPQIESRSCFCHLSKCIWKKLQIITSMQVKYINDADYSFQIRLPTLAFVLINYVRKAFEKLLDIEHFTGHENYFQSIINYFEDI